MQSRRAFLMGLAACPLCAQAARAEDPVWTYEGSANPNNWGELDPHFKSCAIGAEQSPVDLKGGIKLDSSNLTLNWKPEAFHVINNGHTIQATAGTSSSLTLDATSYSLKQFHFHAPSEHALNGERSAMEAHFVHAASDGALTVVGVFMKAGAPNPAFAAVMADAPAKRADAKKNTTLDPLTLLPAKRSIYRYQGSLTTPPCAEIVNWVVMDTPIEVGATDIAAFTKLFPSNARPLQSLHRRFLLRS